MTAGGFKGGLGRIVVQGVAAQGRKFFIGALGVDPGLGVGGGDGLPGQQAGQAGKDRPAIKTPIEGLYIVGAEAGGAGVGTELAANSAIEFFDTYVA